MDSKDLELSHTGKALRASEDILNGLHQIVAQYLAKAICSDDVDPKTIDQAIRFLKDNDIKADPKYSKPIKGLQGVFEGKAKDIDALPFDVDEEDDDEDH